MQPTSIQRTLITKALIISLGAAVALGLARFSYALLLPAMRTSLAWSYAQAGSMNTANAVGYLSGALGVAAITARVGIAHCFWVSLFLTGVGLFVTGLTGDFTLLLLIRFGTGVTTATLFISGATLASHLAKAGQGGLVLGIYFGGVGIGIFLAGLGLPQLLEHNAAFWPYPWLVMGLLTFVAVLVVRPVALGIPTAIERSDRSERLRFPTQLLPAIIAYFLFGLGYISYMTFVIAYLRSSGVSAGVVTLFWLLLGGSTFASAFVWRGLLDEARGGLALAVVLAVVAAGTAIPLASTSLISVLISAILFGGSFLSVVSAITNLVRRSLPPHTWASGIAIFTVIFSLGQTLGPLISGVLADRSSTFTSGFALSAVCLAVGAVLAFFQKTGY